jgi:hypothetical protein
MTQMMPPPLPGYPAPVAPPPQAPPPAATAPAFVPPAYAQPAPQGYPGPAVAAPAPVPGQPQPGTPFPAYAQPGAGYPGPAVAAPAGGGFGVPAAVDIGAAIADATGGNGDPEPPPGKYRFQIVKTIVTQHPIERKLTLKVSLKVLTSSNPACPEGAEVVYIEGLTWGGVRIQDFIVNAMGYPSKAAFDYAMAQAGRDPKTELKFVGNAVGNPDAQQPGNHYPPNPLGGRIVDCVRADVTKTAGPKSAKAGQQVTYRNYAWSPAA